MRIFRCNLQHFSSEARYYYTSETGTSIQLAFSSYSFSARLVQKGKISKVLLTKFTLCVPLKNTWSTRSGFLLSTVGIDPRMLVQRGLSLSREFCRRFLESSHLTPTLGGRGFSCAVSGLVHQLTKHKHDKQARTQSFDILMLMFARWPFSYASACFISEDQDLPNRITESLALLAKTFISIIYRSFRSAL